MSTEEIQLPENLTGLVIVASTRAARGIYEDKSGPIAVEWLRSRGFKTPDAVVIEDRQIIDYFNSLIAEGKKNNNLPTFILTSGGTGLNTDDQTVEAVRRIWIRKSLESCTLSGRTACRTYLPPCSHVGLRA